MVFTLPSELRPIAFDNQALVYALLFRAAASVLKDLAAQRLEARLGILSVLPPGLEDVDLGAGPPSTSSLPGHRRGAPPG